MLGLNVFIANWEISLISFFIGIVVTNFFQKFELKTVKIFFMTFARKDSVLDNKNFNNSNVIDELNEFEPKKTLKEFFPSYKSSIVLQYGSSIRNTTGSFRDKDFIILLVGHPTEKERIMLHEGHSPSLGVEQNNIDVVFRDYNSFLFSLIAGMPYEHSVIRWCKVKRGHKGYILWLKNLAKNILIDRDYLVKRIEERIIEQKNLFVKYNKDSDFYEICREGYFLVSYIIQKNWIKKQSKVLRHKQISDIALTDNMKNVIENETLKEDYLQIVSYLKRDSMVISNDRLIQNINNLCEKL